MPSTPTPLLTRQESRRRAELGLPTLTTTPSPTTPREPSGSTTAAATAPPLLTALLSDSETDPDSSDSSDTPPIRQLLSLAKPSMDSLASQPFASVQVTKLKECPTLTAGRLDPLVLQSWSLACKRYQKHAAKTDAEIVSFVADAMLEPRLISWYQAGQARIDKLTLDAYLAELAQLVLEKNWAHKIRDSIISSRQHNCPFMDWKIEVENLNAILKTSSPTHALTNEGLKVQLEANLNKELKASLLNDPVLSTTLATWSIEAKERDDCIRAEDARTLRLIEANAAARASKRTERRDLLSRLSDPPRTSRTPTSEAGSTPRRNLPKLLDTEKALLNTHDGCTRCRKFYAGHRSPNCPMTAANTWPDAASYVTLTEAAALARCRRHPFATRHCC
ncbi:hypothetical protein LshimejAT787_0102340 [Lyophyllum shimeji]|uniref:Uncharacterized protein n=1 Tax=Lyophyllum shimeji TaxID=47721 RepID=A0A9P3PCA4_LYOSH|nr:hypothetical protein LshimejAT787_0102340 [Lyophyllum shimeji]